MAKNSLNRSDSTRKEEYRSNYYFDNELVERLLYRYKETACTDVAIRDEIMIHAGTLIRNLINAFNLTQITPGKEETDLYQVAWIQIEGAIYKYDARPYCRGCYSLKNPNKSQITDQFMHIDDVIKKYKKCKQCGVKFRRGICPEIWNDFKSETKVEDCNIYYKGTSKIFNMWSQISRTVILAHIKKESRDRKNSPLLINHMSEQTIRKDYQVERFINEAKELCKMNEEHTKILLALEELYQVDNRVHEGMIIKLSEKTQLPRTSIISFLRYIRLMSFNFSDNPADKRDEKYYREGDKEEDEDE